MCLLRHDMRERWSGTVDTEIMIHRFTVKEYHQLADSGALQENSRVELIEGRIIDMTPTGSAHSSCINRLNNVIFPMVQGRAIVSIQNPVQLNDLSEPEPDIALLRYREDFYKGNHPRSDDILLIIEVADASIEYDRKVKNSLYARAGIKETWIVNLNEEIIEIYRSPDPGGYEMILLKRRNQAVTSEVFPDILLSTEQILGT